MKELLLVGWVWFSQKIAESFWGSAFQDVHNFEFEFYWWVWLSAVTETAPDFEVFS